jgi:hypothetical protein
VPTGDAGNKRLCPGGIHKNVKPQPPIGITGGLNPPANIIVYYTIATHVLNIAAALFTPGRAGGYVGSSPIPTSHQTSFSNHCSLRVAHCGEIVRCFIIHFRRDKPSSVRD